MKKVFVMIVAAVLVITACHNAKNTLPVTDSIQPAPVDTVKIDTVKPTDSIIKG
jgi:uncharacterized lipoprotein YajG